MLIYQVNKQKTYAQRKIRLKETQKDINTKLKTFEAYF